MAIIDQQVRCAGGNTVCTMGVLACLLSFPGPVLWRTGESDALVSQVDFLASFAALADVSLDADAGPDSVDVLDALLGRSDEGRAEIVLEGIQARTVLRQGDWVFIPPHQGPPVNTNVNIETGNSSCSATLLSCGRYRAD